MANRTVKDAKSIHGTNPQYLVEKIIRSRIYDSKYWKEECFALTAELLVDKAMELRFVGGVFGGNIRPTPFLCLTLKMLQIQPEKDIVVEFIKNDEFKYVRALGAYYLRLTGTSLDCYNYLEPLLNDNRKLRRQNRSGAFEIVYMDDFIDELLTEDRVCDVILPRLQKRYVLEQNNELQPRISVLEDEDDDDLEEMEEGEMDEKPSSSSKSKEDKSSKSSSRHEKRRHSDSSEEGEYRKKKDRKDRDRKDDRSPESSRRRDRDRDHGSRRDRDRDRSRDRDRRRSRSRDRDYDRRHDDYRRDRDDDRGRRDHDRDRRDRDRHRDRDRDRDRHRSRHDY